MQLYFQSFFQDIICHLLCALKKVWGKYSLGVPTADLTISRPCQTSHCGYIRGDDSKTQRWKFSLSYFKWENAVSLLLYPQCKRFVSPLPNKHDKLFWWWGHYFLIWLLYFRFALGDPPRTHTDILSEIKFNRKAHLQSNAKSGFCYRNSLC